MGVCARSCVWREQVMCIVPLHSDFSSDGGVMKGLLMLLSEKHFRKFTIQMPPVGWKGNSHCSKI